MSSPLFDEGPPVQVHEPALLVEEVELVEVEEVLRLVDDVVDAVVLLEEVLRLVDVVAVVDVERDVVVALLLLVAPPPPVADAETTDGGVGAPALVAQKPNEVDWPAPIVAFHESGVTVSVPPDAPKVPLQPLLSDELPTESVTVQDVTAAVPPLATATLSQ